MMVHVLRIALCIVVAITLYGCLVIAIAAKLERTRRHHYPRIATLPTQSRGNEGGSAAEPGHPDPRRVLDATGTAFPPHPSQVTP